MHDVSFTLSIDAGWLRGALRRPSPNCDERPDPADLSLIVVHSISLPPGQFGGEWIDRLFLNTLPPDAHPYFQSIHRMRVSAHLLIRRDGTLIQYVPFHLRAWHAGASSYGGRPHCNDYSIGIELEGTEHTPYEPVQYARLGQAICALQAHYPGLEAERVTGHSEIAPGRKTDPGPSFDWKRLWRELDRCAGS